MFLNGQDSYIILYLFMYIYIYIYIYSYMILLYIDGYGFLFSSGSGLAIRSSQLHGCAMVKQKTRRVPPKLRSWHMRV